MGDYSFDQAERQILTSEGFLAGLEKIAATKPGLKDTLDGYRSGWLGSWMDDNFAEAEKEVAKIDAALKRLKAASRGIEQSKKISATDPRIGQFRNDLNALDGWTVSLLETVFRIAGFIDPKRTQAKVGELSAAMMKLLNERQTELDPFKKNPSHFSSYMK
jgi:ribosomal protein S8